jgi:T-complex protein 1 subunit theta
VTKLAIPLTESSLAVPLRTVLAAKQYGNEDLLARIVSEASLLVMPRDPRAFNVDNVRVVKVMGGSLYDSRVVKGMVFNREPEGKYNLSLLPGWMNQEAETRDDDAGVVKKATKAKVGVFTSGIDIAQTETKGTVLLKNADELLGFSRGEEKHMEKVRKSYQLFKCRRPFL